MCVVGLFNVLVPRVYKWLFSNGCRLAAAEGYAFLAILAIGRVSRVAAGEGVACIRKR